MPIQFSPIVASRAMGEDGAFAVWSVELHELGELASPIASLDHFRVTGRPFSPHPHAGFSAVTYVFEDSETSLRSRDSLGNDVITGPGGIVWTQAGSGLIHEEIPAENHRELHGLQIFVNLSSENKLVAPQMLRLENRQVPEWRNNAGNRVRVLTGDFEGVSSPLAPAEPFNLFDVHLQRSISLPVADGDNAVVYVLTGGVVVRADGWKQRVASEHAMVIHGSDGRVTLESSGSAHLLILSGAQIREPIFTHGPFIMNEPSQVEAAIARYRNGDMGRLEPFQES